MAVIPINPVGIPASYAVAPIRKARRVVRRGETASTARSGAPLENAGQSSLPASTPADLSSSEVLSTLFTLKPGG